MEKREIISLQNIGKTYSSGDVVTVALQDISFSVYSGEFVAIMGPSGSGKSTLMHILGALDAPTQGSYVLDGTAITLATADDLAQIRNKKIGFVFQSYNLLPRTSALKNVCLPMRYAGIPPQERVCKATEYLEKVGLGNRLHHTTSQLSGGQQQRVAIARALVMEPALLLADEPTGNIASDQASEIMQLFHKLHNDGHTIIMITHEPDIAAHAQRVIMIKDGKLIADRVQTKRTTV